MEYQGVDVEHPILKEYIDNFILKVGEKDDHKIAKRVGVPDEVVARRRRELKDKR